MACLLCTSPTFSSRVDPRSLFSQSSNIAVILDCLSLVSSEGDWDSVIEVKWLRRDGGGLKALGKIVGGDSLGAGDTGNVKGVGAGRQPGNKALRLAVQRESL